MLHSSNKIKYKFSRVIFFPKKCPKSHICTLFDDLLSFFTKSISILKKKLKNKFWTQYLLESDSIKIWVSNLNCLQTLFVKIEEIHLFLYFFPIFSHSNMYDICILSTENILYDSNSYWVGLILKLSINLIFKTPYIWWVSLGKQFETKFWNYQAIAKHYISTSWPARTCS